ncbi:hypothetical protein GWI33_014353 [Rhynchophorus ferrugineus]|uniref:Arf-GAP domain-containing protein n=1 Tax=Rhynchophorus ferrugineus TaxID=354439 RepID=A0A834I2R4_RHYFE|nr:hypothetical protein GWI33_014353 [Rhynchophorus ferrugineus]
MASRKKQDESNMKTLRELGALPQNKFCFDCGQRGPTYVNVTIGSFVCTKCSGILYSTESLIRYEEGLPGQDVKVHGTLFDVLGKLVSWMFGYTLIGTTEKLETGLFVGGFL